MQIFGLPQIRFVLFITVLKQFEEKVVNKINRERTQVKVRDYTILATTKFGKPQADQALEDL